MPPRDDTPPALRPLLGELAASLRERLDVARRALECDDQAAYRAALHAAKGMAMTFGLHALADQALQAEDLSGQPQAARAELERLVRQADAVGGEEKRKSGGREKREDASGGRGECLPPVPPE